MRKIVLGLFFILGACSFRSPDATFYMMNSNDLASVSMRKLSVAVSLVKVPDLLNRSQMVVYQNGNDEVQMLEFNRWGEVFPDVLQATVTNDLMEYLPNAFVKRNYFDSGSLDYSVNIEVNYMRAYKDDKVVLSAWWNIVNSAGKIIKRQQVSYEAKVNGDTMQDLVNAQSNVVHQLSKGVAEALAKL